MKSFMLQVIKSNGWSRSLTHFIPFSGLCFWINFNPSLSRFNVFNKAKYDVGVAIRVRVSGSCRVEL